MNTKKITKSKKKYPILKRQEIIYTQNIVEIMR